MSTPAKDIQLSRQTLSLLKRIERNQHINWKKEEHTSSYKTLAYYNLVTYSPSSNTGSITPKGVQVLLWYEDRKSSELHDWKIAIFSAIAGAFFSEPLWGIIHSLFRLLSENPS